MTKQRLQRLAVGLALAVALGLVGLAVVASGVIPVRASAGHWAVTDWLLHYAMRRSVGTHARATPPPLDDPALTLAGAGHYDLACAPCHGSPSRPVPLVVRAMTPPPPYLPPVVSHWDSDELFEIVKHGVKFTGMPAWPSQQRDDEVWAMVAFLRVLPRLDAAAYRRLVDGERPVAADATPLLERLGTAPTEAVLQRCASCHGSRGEGRGDGMFPALAGQRRGYLAASLDAYVRGARHSGVMQSAAIELTPAERGVLADYYAALPPPAGVPSADVASVARGAEIARHGLPTQRVPACEGCHGDGRRNANYPRLAGQYARYLALQLALFAGERRGGTAYAGLMRVAARGLTPDQRRDVARYYASLAPR